MNLRDDVELTLLGYGGDSELVTRVGNCVDILTEEGILDGTEPATQAIYEIILQAFAEGMTP